MKLKDRKRLHKRQIRNTEEQIAKLKKGSVAEQVFAQSQERWLVKLKELHKKLENNP